MKKMLAIGVALGLLTMWALRFGLDMQERTQSELNANRCALEYLASADSNPERAKRCYTARGLDAPW